MTKFNKSIEINAPVQDVYTFLSDFNNHEQLMPENIEKWSSTKDEAQFTIKNMLKLTLNISERNENQQLVAVPTSKVPFEMILRWSFQHIQPTVTQATFSIEADLNMMMKMMASGPLQKLVDNQVESLKKVLG